MLLPLLPGSGCRSKSKESIAMAHVEENRLPIDQNLASRLEPLADWRRRRTRSCRGRCTAVIIASLLLCGLILPILGLSLRPQWFPEPLVRRFYAVFYPVRPVKTPGGLRKHLIEVVKNAQDFEIRLYQHPEFFHEHRLAKYWMKPTPANQNLRRESNLRSGLFTRPDDWTQIYKDTIHLKLGRRHYGSRRDIPLASALAGTAIKISAHATIARNVLFDVQEVTLLTPRIARVVAVERWYCPMFGPAGRENTRNPNIGPHRNEYFLIKQGSRWLIHNSTVPRYHSPWSKRQIIVTGFVVHIAVAALLRCYRHAVRDL